MATGIMEPGLKTDFPDPIELPPSYSIARARRRKELVGSIWRGVGVRFLIIAIEVIGFFVFGSFALLIDGIASGVDISFSLILLVGIRMAAKPPDEDHPFGHGRYEPLAGLQLSVFMIVAGTVLGIQQFFSAFSLEDEWIISPYAWIIPFIAMILLEICYRFMMHFAKSHHSPALKVEAIHFRIDALNTLFATVALILAAFFPPFGRMFDHFGASLIAWLMVVIGISAAISNVHQLMDKKPDKAYFNLVREAAGQVEGVLDTEKLRIQLSGPDAHVDIDVEVDPKLTVEEAHLISQEVRAEIQKRWSAVRDVIVHLEPYYPNDH
jgi:cation diffusion facilitator family transporter